MQSLQLMKNCNNNKIELSFVAFQLEMIELKNIFIYAFKSLFIDEWVCICLWEFSKYPRLCSLCGSCRCSAVLGFHSNQVGHLHYKLLNSFDILIRSIRGAYKDFHNCNCPLQACANLCRTSWSDTHRDCRPHLFYGRKETPNTHFQLLNKYTWQQNEY